MAMIKIFNATDTDFSTAGNIIIDPLYCHEIKKKSLNGWYIEVEVSINFKEYISKDKLCVIQTKSKLNPQAFRISDSIQYTTKKIKFKAEHVIFDARDYCLLDARPTNLTGNNVLNYINERTDNTSPFTVFSNVIHTDTAYFIRKNLFEAWQIIEERWGGVFDVDNWNISLLNSVGNDNGETIIYGKNMQGFEIYEDWSNVCTKLCPVGFDGLLLPEQFLTSEIQYEKPYTRIVDFLTELEIEEQTEENLLAELRTKAEEYLEENKIPKVSYTINSDINEDMEIGDTIKVLHPFVEICTEVLEYEYNIISQKVISLTFGNYSRAVKAKVDSIKESINKIVTDMSKQEVAIKNQTELINLLNKEGYVYIDDNEILILDTLPKENAQNVWRFGLAGLGFSSNGYEGPFEIAITIDGKINANFITAGSMSVSRITGLSQTLSNINSAIELNNDRINARVALTEDLIGTLENITEETIETITKLGEIKETELAEYISVDASYNPATIEIHGESKQETRSGKNLLKLNASRVSNGITITNNLDGTLIFNGTATANFDIWIANGYSSTEIVKEFPAGTKIAQKLNIINGTVVGRYSLRTIVHNGTVLDWNTVSNDTVYTFPMNGNIRCTEVYVTAGTIFNNFKIFPQLEIGAVSSEPEQYGVMPSPGFISPIKSVNTDKLDIVARGKNNFNLNTITYNTKVIKLETGVNLSSAWCNNLYSEKELKRVFKPNAWYTIKATSKIISKPSTIISAANYDFVLYRENNNELGGIWTTLYNNNKSAKNIGDIETFVNMFKTPADLTDCVLNSYSFYGNNDGSAVGTGIGEIEVTDIMLVEGQYTSDNFPQFEGYKEKKYELKNSNIFDMDDWYNTIRPLNSDSMEKVNVDGYDYIKMKPHLLNYNYEYMLGQFEENTQYTIRFKGRQFSQIAQISSGLTIHYTDNTYGNIYIARDYIDKEYVLTSAKNKTISYIGLAYAYAYFVLIRDIEIRKNIVLKSLPNGKTDNIKKEEKKWLLTRNINTRLFTPVNAITALSNTFYATNSLVPVGVNTVDITNENVVCEKAKCLINIHNPDTCYAIESGNTLVVFGSPGETVTSFNEKYAGMEYQYELRNPIVEEIVDKELIEGLESIYTEKGFNYITIENSDIKPYFKLEYYENNNINETLATKNELNQIEKNLNAEILIKNNEIKTNVKSEVTTALLTLINNNYLTAEQIQALVGGTVEDITTIKNQLTQTITDRDMQIAITTAINNGVSYFKNTLFTINENGMWIATTADEFSAQYDNTGMYLYSFEEMIAKYDKDGATLKNLKVEGNIETQNLKIVNATGDLGEDRVHIHWIGGGI